MNYIRVVSFFLSSLIITAQAQGDGSGGCPSYNYEVFQGTANGSSGLQSTVSGFQTAIGGDFNGNSPGPLPSGFRSVNWDAPIVPFNMPFSFFRDTVTRGIFFKTATDKFVVSNPTNEGVSDIRFSSFNSQFPDLFKTFSEPRLFASEDSTKITARFTIPASNETATTAAFGAVLTNVRKQWLTSLAFYDKNNCLIHKVNAQQAAKGLSFVGLVVYNQWDQSKNSAIGSVVFSLGDATISAPYNADQNVVVVDDLIYAEPKSE